MTRVLMWSQHCDPMYRPVISEIVHNPELHRQSYVNHDHVYLLILQWRGHNFPEKRTGMSFTHYICFLPKGQNSCSVWKNGISVWTVAGMGVAD